MYRVILQCLGLWNDSLIPLITLEEYAEKHNLDVNYLHLLAAANRLPHKRLLGRIYLDEHVLGKIEEEQRIWARAWKKTRI